MKELYIYIMRNGMRSAVLVLLWVVTLFTQNLPAQSWQVGDIWPEEPHAAKLRKVTMAPPALSTGAVTFQVPLYDIKVEDLVLPLELRYHSNGIRIDEDPYPVGYGWSLLPAFRITRQVLGRPDGRGFEFVGNKAAADFTHAELQRCMVRYELLRNPGLDPEKDLFTVHMPEGTFTGIYEDGEILMPGHKEYKVTCSSDMKTLEVTDPKGRVWTFGEKGAIYQGSDILEWGLQRILLPSGKEVTVTWGLGFHKPPTAGIYHPYTLYYPDNYGGYTPYVFDLNSGKDIRVDSGIPDNSLNPVSIKFPGGEVSFIYNETDPSCTLKGITVTATGGQIPKIVENITFSRGTTHDERTMLQAVSFLDGSRYSFSYNSGRFNGTGNADYWGYCNNKAMPKPPSMNISIPYASGGNTIEGTDRSPDAGSMQARLLTSVTYPTGAVCSWEYEPHRFEEMPFHDGDTWSTPDRKLSWGGGVRVTSQTLRRNASDNRPYTVEYIYGENGDGLAVAESYPTANTFLSLGRDVTGTIIYYGSEISGSGQTYPWVWQGPVFYGSVTASPWSRWMDYRFGEQPIWYREVEERHPEGKVRHVFDKPVANLVFPDLVEGTWPREIQTAFGAGVVESLRTEYETAPEGDRPVRETEWTYLPVDGGYPVYSGIKIRRRVSQSTTEHTPDFPEDRTLDLGGLMQGYPSFYSYGEQEIYEPLSYKMYPYVMELQYITEREYTPNGEIVRDRWYKYRDGTSIVTTESLTDGANTLTHEYLYPFNTTSTVSTAMMAANQQGVMLGERVKYGTAISEHRMEYARIGQGNLFRPVKETASRGTATPYTVATYEWNTDGTLKTRTGADGVRVSYGWDTAGLYPVSMTTGGKLTQKLSWEPLVGVSSMTDEAGLKTSFTYDDGRRLTKVTKGGRLLEQYSYAVSQTGTNTVTAKRYTSTSQSHSQVSRIDGLGREWATFTETPDGGIVTLAEYDGMGRLSKSWFPAPGTSGMNETQLRQAVTGFYSDTAPWRQTNYRPSPTEEVISEMRGGAAWLSGGHVSTREVYANGIPDRSYLKHTITSDGVRIAGMTPAGQLRWETVTDEDGLKSTKLTDLRGLTLYESKGGPGATYVYDDYGDLRYILPSGCTQEGKRTDSRLPAEAYWYDYDERGRMILSHVPGTRDARYIYDPADRLVAEQTANHPAGTWRVYAYDGCGRKVIAADCDLTDSQAQTFGSEVRKATYTASGSWAGYTFDSLPAFTPEDYDYVGVWYYDNYDFVTGRSLGSDFLYRNPASISGFTKRLPSGAATQASASDATGKLTGFHTYRGWETYYYDSMGQLCQTCSSGFNRGRKVMTFNYDLSPASTHGIFGGAFPDTDTYTAYDRTGRLVETRIIQRRKAGNTEICDTAVMTTVYDKIGRVTKSMQGNIATTHTYDVHGWLRTTETKAPVGKPLYSQKLMYADGKTPLYDGRISSKEWTQSGTPHRYDYTYGSFGFLTKAAYSGGAPAWDYSTSYSYDMRGNITSMKRNGIIDMAPSRQGVYGLLDDITASYSAYKLTSLSVESEAETFASRTGMRSEGTFEMEYDFAGRLTYDSSRDIRSISYDLDGLMLGMDVGDDATYSYQRDGSGNLLSSSILVRSDNGRSRIVKFREYTGNGHIVVDDSLKMTRFPGGYFTPDGGVYYYINDYQGNICKVVDKTGRVYQRMDYYPYGEPFQEWNWDLAEREKGMSSNRYLYSGNERETGLGVNQYDFQARTYVASFPRFSSIDPEAARYAGFSPYLYSNGDPINNIDPNGRSTRVKQTGENTYEVIGGELDGDLNVYLYTPDEYGKYTVKGKSIGITPTETSFYNSDSGIWMEHAKIDLGDTSGEKFLSDLINDTPLLPTYALNATNGEPYDFKVTNGTDKEFEGIDHYRGMPIGKNENGLPLIASARDIGNIGAGYVAAANGLSYLRARIGFDGYQFITKATIEGPSTRNAEYFGYKLGQLTTNPVIRPIRLIASLTHLAIISSIYKKINK